MNTIHEKSTFSALWDFTVTDFVTLNVVKLLYLVAVALVTVAAVGIFVVGFSNGIWAGPLSLILAPLFFIIAVLITRVYLELFVVFFRIASSVVIIAEHAGSSSSELGSQRCWMFC
jgi:hypothetical protein